MSNQPNNTDVSVIIDETTKKIADVINGSRLNPAVIELILKDVLNQVTIIKLQGITNPKEEGDTNG